MFLAPLPVEHQVSMNLLRTNQRTFNVPNSFRAQLSKKLMIKLRLQLFMEMTGDISSQKGKLRRSIWSKMEREGLTLFPKPCFGRIPNFLGADRAAARLKEIPEYRRAKIVLVNPDAAQAPVRMMALLDGKTVVMPTPRLRRGFLILEPDRVRGKERLASTIKGAFKYGRIAKALPKVDFVVEGCVAVDKTGNRLGKGGGYGDKEIKLAKRVSKLVKVATTCHSTQVVDKVPFNESDEKVDYIATENDLIRIDGKTEGKGPLKGS